MIPACSILIGDVRTRLRELPDESVQCVVTSPPYFGLRDYGAEGQIGLEATPMEYVGVMVDVFREIRRVLKSDGTVWLNLGDSYSRAASKGGSGPDGKNEDRWGYGAAPSAKAGSSDGQTGRADRPGGTRNSEPGIAPKNLLGIPWRVAFALQADGWWLRSDIIWHKPNPMPESVTDRPTKSHEYLFLLSRSADYFYDAEAIAEKTEYPGDDRARRTDTRKAVDPFCIDGGSRERTGNPTGETRNKRTVWTIATQPYSGAHFAVMPPDLVRPCILAGSRIGDVVLDPFGGSGTVGMVANEYGRNAILIDLNPANETIIQERLAPNAGQGILKMS